MADVRCPICNRPNVAFADDRRDGFGRCAIHGVYRPFAARPDQGDDDGKRCTTGGCDNPPTVPGTFLDEDNQWHVVYCTDCAASLTEAQVFIPDPSPAVPAADAWSWGGVDLTPGRDEREALARWLMDDDGGEGWWDRAYTDERKPYIRRADALLADGGPLADLLARADRDAATVRAVEALADEPGEWESVDALWADLRRAMGGVE